MSTKINQKFKGIITNINEWGIFVEELETKCDGLIRSRDIKGDFYIFDEKNISLIGKKTNKKYRLGDYVTIMVKKTDIAKKMIDYILVE